MSNNILKEIYERRSFRAFDEKPLPQDQINRLLEAATLAPSCFNNQPWRFVVVTDEAPLERLHGSLTRGNYWAKKAPLAIALITKLEEDCQQPEGRDYAYFDTGMAAMNLLLQAQKEGLYSHYIAGFDAKIAKEVLEVPDDWTLLTLGFFGLPGNLDHLGEKHQSMEGAPRSRKPFSEIVFYQKMNQ